MVDFGKLRQDKKKTFVINPNEVFRRLPKPTGINDIYTSQSEVLEKWFERRNEKDIVIKLHTGGGKTLVGLLIAQSIMNETEEPVLYLCPTKQLVDQINIKSKQYGIPSIAYESGIPGFPEEFLGAKNVLIATYEALFNGRTKFGVFGQGKKIIKLGGIILDDAHVAYSRVRDAYTLRIRRAEHPDDYAYLTGLFRNEFINIGRPGIFDDTISGTEKYSVLEVPYWAWNNHLQEVREYIRKRAETDYPFAWPLIRDNLEQSIVLICDSSFVITPYFPLTDIIPAFYKCSRRIYMSATIADDSSIIRTFDADRDSISKPISSNSLAGVGERMILIPEWMKLDSEPQKVIKQLAIWAADEKKLGTVILTPSGYVAQAWKDTGQIANTSEEASQLIRKLQENQAKGPFVFSNRYDGIDLPHDACRLLIFANMPRGTNEYENYLANLFEGSILNNTLAQKIEQGIGRGARGSGDYCVILIYGKDVLSWIARPQNAKYLTRITRSQMSIGVDISQSISSDKEVKEAVIQCLDRNGDWIKYHAETLAELTEADPINLELLNHAQLERRAFRLWIDAKYEKAVSLINNYCENTNELDDETKGWFYQLAARIAYFGKLPEISHDLQHKAFTYSRNLFRPQKVTKYERLLSQASQTATILKPIKSYTNRKGYLAKYDEISSHLIPEASSNVFEQNLTELGTMLGFLSERPEKAYGIGPDVLWILNDHQGLVIEAKSRKEQENALTKDEHGQVLNSELWFQKEYPGYESTRVIVHPNKLATDKVIIGSTKVLTFEKLNSLVSNGRILINELCSSISPMEELEAICEMSLSKYKLLPEEIILHYLEDFINN